MAKFFIERPIFAWVIAIMMMLGGLLAISKLPVEQYPDIAPPSVTVSAIYTGADAETVENTVTQIIEQSLTGLDGLMYMSSNSSSSGRISVTLTFEPGTNPDVAQVQVLNKVESAKVRLPDAVQTNGIRVAKQNSNFLKVIGFYDETGEMNQTQIADYIYSNIQNDIGRVNGVGDTMLFGGEYAMRIWLNPSKLVEYNLTTNEIIAALKAQNAQVTAGQLGGSPSVPGQQLNASITAQSRLTSVAEFEQILVRVNTDGSQIRLKDVARVELGSSSYGFIAQLNGKESAGLGIYLASGANQLDASAAVEAKMVELSKAFPAGLKYVEPFDSTPFVQLSIHNVVKTLFEAIVLVVIVMYLFLQNMRSTLIPTITVPVVLLGTFCVLFLMGYSVNTLSMFAMVLAIGLLVDDSIVVIENVERIMDEEGLSPKEATKKSMGQITGALVGIGIVLSAVFLPMAFMGGATGGIYRQFSVTIVTSMVLSVASAIILTPALCATILKPRKDNEKHKKTTGFFSWFNRTFEKGTQSYTNGVQRVLKSSKRYLVIYLIICGGLFLGFKTLPSSFIPVEDQGVALAIIQLPSGSTQEQTQKVLDKITHHIMTEETKGIEQIFTINGFSMAGQGQNAGLAFFKLKDWSERGKGQDIDSILQRINVFLATQLKDVMAFAVNIPAIPALGMENGFSLVLQDSGGKGHDALMNAMFQLIGMASQEKSLQSVRPNGLLDVPQFNIDVNFEKTQVLGLSLNEVNSTLSTVLGSAYVDDFIYNNRVKRVYVQGDAPYRMNPSDINYWYVKNMQGQMVPFSAFATTNWGYGSPQLKRYNGYPSMDISGSAAPGVSSGDAMLKMEELAKKLPEGFSIDWTGLSYQERQSGSSEMFLYLVSAVTVFLCLAALYESWTIPISVLLVIPLGIIGAVFATLFRGLENDVYFKVGLLTTMGLTAKNAILIIEFAEDSIKQQGKSTYDAIVEACKLRLRPILMTSFAFIFGVLPLAISSGAGAASQHSVGTGVIGGMIGGTILAIFFIPLFFYTVVRLFSSHHTDNKKEATPKT